MLADHLCAPVRGRGFGSSATSIGSVHPVGPACLLEIGGRPALIHVMNALAEVGASSIAVIARGDTPEVSKRLSEEQFRQPDGQPVRIHVIERDDRDLLREPSAGPDDGRRRIESMLTALSAIDGGSGSLSNLDADDAQLVVVSGHLPLLDSTAIAALLRHHRRHGSAAAVLTLEDDHPRRARLVSDQRGRLVGVAPPVRSPFRESEGLMAANHADQPALVGLMSLQGSLAVPIVRRAMEEAQWARDPSQFDEHSILTLLIERGYDVEPLIAPDPMSGASVDDLISQAEAAAEFQRRVTQFWMSYGVIIDDPARVHIDAAVSLAPGVRIFAGSSLWGRTEIAEGAQIGPDTHLVDTAVGRDTIIESSTARCARIADQCVVGPYAVCGPGSQLPVGTVTGAFYAADADG